HTRFSRDWSSDVCSSDLALTSLVCKAGNILLQIVAIPMALVVLGREDFGVFATVSSLIGFIILSDLGVGPGLTNLLAKKIASDEIGRASCRERAESSGRA